MPQNFNLTPLMTAVDNNGKSMSKEWYPWFQATSNAVNSLYQYGTTAQRPTSNVYLGQLYFDTTLGTLVMLTNLSPLTWIPFNVAQVFTPDAFLFSNASGAVTATAAATNGQLLIGSTGVAPQIGTLTGTTNEVIVTNGAGSITLSLPQAIGTSSTPTFGGLTLSDLTQNGFLTIGASGVLGSTAAATNGQLLIGASSGAPVAANLTAGAGIGVTNGSGSITISNSGVTSAVAGTGIGVSGATGAVTISNTGVTSLTAGSGITLSGSTGAVTISANGSGLVTSITGTTNEVIASSSTGAVTLSLPQAIATTSSVTFGNVTDSALTPNGMLYAGAGGLLTSTAAPTNGQLLIGSTGSAPVLTTLTAGTGVTITNGAGSITINATGTSGVTSITGTANQVIASASTGAVTLSLPQSIATTSAVQFGTIVQSDLAAVTGISATTSGSTATLALTDTGSNGANIKLTGNGSTTPSKYIRAEAGDLMVMNNAYSAEIFVLDDSGNGTFTGVVNGNGNDALLYGNSHGQTIASGTATTVTNWTKIFDKLGTNFNASTGTFTAPSTGYYQVSCSLTYGVPGAAVANGSYAYILFYVNGAQVVASGSVYQEAAQVSNVVNGSVCLYATVGQQISITAYQTSGQSIALVAAANECWVSITRVP
jgi:hypothetical protein